MTSFSRRSWIRLAACALSNVVAASHRVDASLSTSVTPTRVVAPAVDFDASWPIASNPDLGEYTSDAQQVVDFALWQARDRSYQLWSCIRNTKAPGETRLFHGWEGAALEQRDWRPKGIVQMTRPEAGELEGHIQAPFVVTNNSTFSMFYSSGGRIYVQTSRDGKTFSRRQGPGDHPWLFGAGNEARDRDPMVMRANGRWYLYYTGAPKQQGVVYARTSTDLARWREPTVVAFGGAAGTGPLSAECPHVVFRGGAFYLFRTQRYGAEAQTSVYRSRNPLMFGINEDDTYFVSRLPLAAPEILQIGGRDYIAYLESSLKGIRVAPLDWVSAF